MKNPPQIKFPQRSLIGVAAKFAASLLTIGAAQAQLNDGLLTYWDFEDNFNDTASTFSTDSAVADNGVGGSNVFFEDTGPLGTFGDFIKQGVGTENLVTVPDSVDLDASGEDLTVSLWFQVAAFDQNWQALIVHGEGGDWRMARRNRAQGVAFAGGAGSGDVPGQVINVNDGEWHHAVGISENGVSTRMWIDGVLVGTGGAPTIAANGSPELFIGGNPDANLTPADATQFRSWNGGIDDIALWNRPLTDAEIQQIFDAGAAGIPLSSLLDAPDTDGDGLPDAFEIINGLDPEDDGSTDPNNGAAGDPDGDGSTNLQEFNNSTDPQDEDTDDDFSNDGQEAINGTIPTNPDTDGDSLLDGHETNTAVFVSTTDTGTDPLVSDLDLDTDGDGLFNVFEINNALDPFDDGTTDPNNGGAGDPDADDSSNLDEQANGTDPQNPDTDGDDLSDGDEAANGSDPLVTDTDNDGLDDNEEVILGEDGFMTLPTNPDSDDDGFTDGEEFAAGTNPNDSNSTPVVNDTLPLFDDFEDGTIDLATFSILEGTISQNGTGTVLGGTIEEVDGCVQFGSRGYLHTRAEFDPEVTGGLGITGEFSAQTGNDIFSILTRANPVPVARFGEATSGVQFQLSVFRNEILIGARNGDHTVTSAGSVPFTMDAGTFYNFQVIDDGAGALSLTVFERDNPSNNATVTAELTADTSDFNSVLFYNRENGSMSSIHELTIETDPTPITLPTAGGDEIVVVDCSFNAATDEFSITWESLATATYAINASDDLAAFDIPVQTGIQGVAGTTTLTFPTPDATADTLFFQISEE